MLDRLAADGVPVALTMSLTPPLAAMLRMISCASGSRRTSGE